eukprot:1482589-Amphidinium_carterae.1
MLAVAHESQPLFASRQICTEYSRGFRAFLSLINDDKVPEGVISIEPEIRTLDIGDSAEALVICASDGLWDAIGANALANIIETHPGLEELCDLSLQWL